VPTARLLLPLGRAGFGNYAFNLARELVPALESRGFSVSMGSRFPVDHPGLLHPGSDPGAQRILAALHRPAEAVPDVGLSMNDISGIVSIPARRLVHFTMHEGSRVPEEVARRFAALPAIAMPSAWNVASLAASWRALGLAPGPRTYRWPGGAADGCFAAEPGPSPLRAPVFTFSNVAKFERRKGIHELARAFASLALQRPRAQVRLLAHWHHGWEPAWRRLVRRMLLRCGFDSEGTTPDGLLDRYRHRVARGATVEVVTGMLATEDEVRKLYRASDAAIYPAFAEGWGLPLIESMACGLPVAAGDWSGPSEFLAPGTFLPFAASVERPMTGPFYGDADWGTWREPAVAAIRDAMAALLDWPAERRRDLGAAARAHVAARFTWRRAAHTIADDLAAMDAEA